MASLPNLLLLGWLGVLAAGWASGQTGAEAPRRRSPQPEEPLVLPAGFWEKPAVEAATELYRANCQLAPQSRLLSFRPVAGGQPIPASGSATLALGYTADNERGNPAAPVETVFRFIVLRWSPAGAEFLHEARSRFEPGGRQSLSPAQCRQLLEVTQCLLSAEAEVVGGRPEGPSLVIVNRGPWQVEFKASDPMEAWQLRLRSEFHRHALPAWGSAQVDALRATLVTSLWWQTLTPPKTARPPVSREEDEHGPLRHALASADAFFDPPASAGTLRLAWFQAGNLAAAPIVEGERSLQRMRALVGSASAQLAPEAERLRSALDLAERRFRLARSPAEMAKFLACPSHSYEGECAWALAWLQTLRGAELAAILRPAFPELSPELQQRWFPELQQADPAAAAEMVEALARQGSPAARNIQAQALLSSAMQGEEEEASRFPGLIALARDRALELELRARAVRHLSPTSRRMEHDHPGISPLMVELVAQEPAGSELLGRAVWSVARRRPAGGFAAVRTRWQAGDFAPGEARESALVALAVCSEQAGADDRRWLASSIAAEVQRGAPLGLLAAWMAEQWELLPSVRDLTHRPERNHATVFAHWWLAIAQASGTERLQRAIAFFGEQGTDNLFWHPQGQGKFDFDRKAVIIGWLRRAITPLGPEERKRVRAFLKWEHDRMRGGVDSGERELILRPVEP